jgi:hypothetical protein
VMMLPAPILGESRFISFFDGRRFWHWCSNWLEMREHVLEFWKV